MWPRKGEGDLITLFANEWTKPAGLKSNDQVIIKGSLLLFAAVWYLLPPCQLRSKRQQLPPSKGESKTDLQYNVRGIFFRRDLLLFSLLPPFASVPKVLASKNKLGVVNK